MRPKSLMLLVVAVGCGLLAMLALNAQSGSAKQEKVKVLVVAVDSIPANEPLKDEMLGWMEVSQNELLWDAITRKEDYEGKALNVTMVKNEMITKSRLTDRFNASTEVPFGKQVVTVNVDISTSHAGQIRPGDIVDVYTTYSVGQLGGTRGNPETKTKVVLSQIQVFSIDSIRSTNTPGNEDVLAKTVSLLVEPQQAEVLLMASKKGSIHLGLRNKNDTTETDVPILTESDFDDINSTDPEIVSDTDAPAAGQDFTKSEVYRSQKSELERLQKELENLRAEKEKGDLQKQVDLLNEAKAPSWIVTVFNGRNKEEIRFKEEEEEESALPEVPKGDAPSTDDDTSG